MKSRGGEFSTGTTGNFQSELTDMSPDEQLVATECTKTTVSADSSTKTFVEVVQIWNFREDRLVAEFPVVRVEVQARGKAYFPDPVRGARIVRFSPDGNVVVALIDQKIYVLRVTDLAELRTISLVAPGTVTQDYYGITTVSKTFVSSLEISPHGDTLAIFWASEFTFGRIELYDLSSGSNTLSWETPKGWTASTNGLHWHPKGKLLLIAFPNATSCQPLSHKPDVFAFDVQTGTIKHKLTTGMDAPRIVVTSDDRVLVVQGDCAGPSSHNDAKLRVFDLTTGKRLRDVSGSITGVGSSVAASADGTRFLAFAGKVKKTFDWGDFYFGYVDVDRKFSVWSLTNYAGIVTSQNIPELNGYQLRLSPKGRYVVSYGKTSFVYELP